LRESRLKVERNSFVGLNKIDRILQRWYLGKEVELPLWELSFIAKLKTKMEKKTKGGER